jgi:hypothetical protein
MLLLTDDFRLIAEIKATMTIRNTSRTSFLLISLSKKRVERI